MYSVIAYFSFIIAMISIVLALRGKYYYYWIAAIGIYLFSFMAGFSIGKFTVGLTFIPLTMAIGHLCGWIHNKKSGWISFGFGIIIAILLVLVAGDYLFYPLFRLLQWI
ncbi:hypothetical protein [Gracilibacillus alcaliphilus]|uniref:hypothetical protein n=1 Tax=Gracilibacillus alcaliphilus TaxID=1401441 RepID=UPI00195A002B|nr:hypothetical protein [Gracilibacillus alcaliphilus]MBM7679709.1 putative lysophospholipase L1 biosynthesis ABC-type transport system permease subunit [Gracilibacillus alcaliphilus]